MSIEEKINAQLKDNDILIYMKGSPYEPKCGFSAKTVQALIDCGAEFSFVDILENQDIRIVWLLGCWLIMRSWVSSTTAGSSMANYQAWRAS